MSSCIRIKAEKVLEVLKIAEDLFHREKTRKWENLYQTYLCDYHSMWFPPKYPMSPDQFKSDYRRSKNGENPDRWYLTTLKINLELAIETAMRHGDKYIYLSLEDHYSLLTASSHYWVKSQKELENDKIRASLCMD